MCFPMLFLTFGFFRYRHANPRPLTSKQPIEIIDEFIAGSIDLKDEPHGLVLRCELLHFQLDDLGLEPHPFHFFRLLISSRIR